MRYFLSRMIPSLLLLVIFVSGCHEVCEYQIISDIDQVEIEFPRPGDSEVVWNPGDKDTFPQVDGDLDKESSTEYGDDEKTEDTDGDVQVDGDQDSDQEIQDGDTETIDGPDGEGLEFDIEYDAPEFIPDGDIDWELSPADADPTDIEDQQPDEMVLPYDRRQLVEFSPFGFWEYRLTNDGEGESRAVCRMKAFFDSEDILFEHDGEDGTSNPPIEVSSVQVDESYAWAANLALNVDGRLDEAEPLVLRREKRGVQNSVEVSFWRSDVPTIASGFFEQLVVLPRQSRANSEQVEVLAAYIWSLSDSDAFLILQNYLVSVADGDPVFTASSEQAMVRLIGGHDSSAKLRFVVGEEAVWLNAGGSIHKCNATGEYQTSYSLNYSLEDVLNTSIVDLSVSPDGSHLAALGKIEKNDGDIAMVWSIHGSLLPSVILKQRAYPYEYLRYRCAFSSDNRYAVLANSDPNVYNDFYFIDLQDAEFNVHALNQTVWGRPLFIDDPSRMLTAYPLSTDGFASYDLLISVQDVEETFARSFFDE